MHTNLGEPTARTWEGSSAPLGPASWEDEDFLEEEDFLPGDPGDAFPDGNDSLRCCHLERDDLADGDDEAPLVHSWPEH